MFLLRPIGMARLQTEMGSIRIRWSDGAIRSVRTHLAARHCAVQQVSACYIPIQPPPFNPITHSLSLHFTHTHKHMGKTDRYVIIYYILYTIHMKN